MTTEAKDAAEIDRLREDLNRVIRERNGWELSAISHAEGEKRHRDRADAAERQLADALALYKGATDVNEALSDELAGAKSCAVTADCLALEYEKRLKRQDTELAEARGLLREHLEIIEEDLDKGRYAVPGLLKARADRIRAAIDKAGGG